MIVNEISLVIQNIILSTTSDYKWQNFFTRSASRSSGSFQLSSLICFFVFILILKKYKHKKGKKKDIKKKPSIRLAFTVLESRFYFLIKIIIIG